MCMYTFLTSIFVCFRNEKPNTYQKLKNQNANRTKSKQQQQQQPKIWHIPHGWASLSVILFLFFFLRYSLSYFICMHVQDFIVFLSFHFLFYFIFVMCDVIHSFEKKKKWQDTHTKSNKTKSSKRSHAHAAQLTFITFISYDYFKIKT